MNIRLSIPVPKGWIEIECLSYNKKGRRISLRFPIRDTDPPAWSNCYFCPRCFKKYKYELQKMGNKINRTRAMRGAI